MEAQDGSSPESLIRIGYREWISIPAWGIAAVRAKADTGAKSSAIDVANIQVFADNRVRFDLIKSRRQRHIKKTVEAQISRQTHVKSSTGEGQERYFVKVEVRIGQICKEVEFGLVSREGMINRVLIGRRALEGEFLVDSAVKYLLGKPVDQGGLK